MYSELKYYPVITKKTWEIIAERKCEIAVKPSSLTTKICTTGHISSYNPYPTAFPYGNGMVLHFYQQQESSTTKTVHKVINKGLKTYV